MGIEAATYINQLVNSNPLGTDKRTTADDHIRLIKTTLNNSLPNVGGAVTASHGRMNLVFTEAMLLNTANTLSGGSIDMSTGLLDNPQLQSYSETFVSKGAVQSNASATLDMALANNFAMTISTATLSLSFANFRTAGVMCTVTVEVTQDGTGSRTLKYPAAVKWSGGVTPPIAQSAGAVSTYTFRTRDAGATIHGYQTGFDVS